MTEQVDERSISKTLEKLLDELLKDVDSEALARIFLDAKGEIEYGNVPKRKRHKGIEDVEGL